LDNLSIDTNEALWAAGFPDRLAFISAYYDLEKVAASSALRITKNVGNEAFFGEKLKVEKVRKRTLWNGASRGSVTYFPRVGIRR
jgi:arylesterase / paraoxonase